MQDWVQEFTGLVRGPRFHPVVRPGQTPPPPAAPPAPPPVNVETPIRYFLNDPLVTDLVKDVPVPKLTESIGVNVIGYRGGGFDPGSPEGHAANAYVTVINAINNFNRLSEDKKLKSWAAVPELIVVPHFGQKFNAFYDRRSLSFGFETDPSTNQAMYCCSSADVVSHELGHAILDSFRPDLWGIALFEVWAFHEGWSDFMAMISSMQYDEVIQYALNQTNGDLRQHNIIANIAEQFGKVLYTVTGGEGRSPGWLRSCINDYKYVNPETLPAETPFNVLGAEPHNFSRILSGTMYDVMMMMYDDHLAKGMSNLDAMRSAQTILAKYAIKAIQFTPNTPRFFEGWAKTLLWVDFNLPGRPYHDRMYQIFVNRGLIQPLSMMATKSFQPEIKPVKLIKLGDHFPMLRAQSTGSPIYDLNLEVSGTDDATVSAAHHLVSYLFKAEKVGSNGEPFDVQDGKLVRTCFNCDKGCGKNPQSPEFLKPPKPENNAGCCGGCRQPPVVEAKPVAKKGCIIRYQVRR